MNLSEKETLVSELHKSFSDAKIVILTDYKGLDVTSMTKLRRNLSESGIKYRVAKNTLLIRASSDTDAAILEEHFKGSTAIALSDDDVVAPAKILFDFAKENKKLEIKVGVMDGKFLDSSSIEKLAKLPPREELLSHVLRALNGVPTSFVRVLSGSLTNLLNVLNAIKEKKE